MSTVSSPLKGYESHFDESKFRSFLTRASSSIQLSILRRLLVLYYCLKDPSTPLAAKATIVGALGYSMLSSKPVAVPVIGPIYLYDASLIAGAFVTVAACLKPEHYEKADRYIMQTFGRSTHGESHSLNV